MTVARATIGAALFALFTIGQGCGPCFGVVTCTEKPHIAVGGQILIGETGTPVAEAALTLIARLEGGAADSVKASSNSDGTFSLLMYPNVSVLRKLSLRVVPAGYPGYIIDSLRCAPVVVRGDACILNPMVPAPWVPIHALISYRNSDVRAANVRVTFERTGGAEFAGPAAVASYVTQTDGSGIATLFPEGLYATALDSIVGNLIVDLPPPYGTSIRRGYVVRPFHEFATRPLDIFGIGPNIDYIVSFIDSTTAAPLAGVEVRFLRVSGVPLEPQALQATSSAAGIARLLGRPLATGPLSGDLVIKARPNGATTTVSGFSLPTFDSDTTRVGGRWRVGATGVLYPLPSPPSP